jgi:hypothetical protein
MSPEQRLGEGLHRGVPMAVYHGNCCPGPSVSASVLVEMRDGEGCPAKALARHYLSPWARAGTRPEDDSEARSFGRAAHAYLVEGPDLFAQRYAVKPQELSFATKDGKAWKAAHVDREIVPFDRFETIKGMAAGLGTNAATAAAFTGGEAEVTAIVQDRETGLWLKARPDYLRPGLALNYKTAASAAREPFMRQAWSLGYPVGAALAVDVLAALGERCHGCFIVQEKSAPYLAKAWVLADDYLAGARAIYRRALRSFADSLAAGRFDGYGDEVGTLPCPPWAVRKLDSLHAAS